MTAMAELEANNRRYAETGSASELPAPPRRRVAVVTCMDARIDVYRMLGLELGDAHVIRNAGGVVTDDVIRSICLSQQKLGTTEIMVIHHTRCGMEGVDDSAVAAGLEEKFGKLPPWPVGGFRDVVEDTRRSVDRLAADSFIEHADTIAGYVYDVDTGQLIPVDPPSD